MCAGRVNILNFYPINFLRKKSSKSVIARRAKPLHHGYRLYCKKNVILSKINSRRDIVFLFTYMAVGESFRLCACSAFLRSACENIKTFLDFHRITSSLRPWPRQIRCCPTKNVLYLALLVSCEVWY